jgi:hypothetical protein
MRFRALLVAIPALAGCAIVVKAFSVPYVELCDAGRCTTNHLPTLLNDVNYEVSWLVVVPGAAVGVAVVAVAFLVLVTRPNLRVVAAWSLTAAGVVTLAFFGLLRNAYGAGGRWGALIGLFGGFLIIVAGLGAAAFTFRSRVPHNLMNAR